jgi:ParB family transcriptional regulator, chromosome partitioning protein
VTRKKRLGRGLEALLGVTGDVRSSERESQYTSVATEEADVIGFPLEPTVKPLDERNLDREDIVRLSVYEIDNNPFQPRREFSQSEIRSLSESLKDHDLLQPILVRKVGNRYQLISGERRLRASIQAGWTTIPARIREADDRLVAELAIVENLQRKDLNAIEKALSFKRYIEQHGCTQEDLAARLKIDRSTLTNLIRLLELPKLVREALQQDKITAGHARSLLPLADESAQIAYCNRIQSEGWSVRQTEREVTQCLANETPEVPKPVENAKQKKNAHVQAITQDLKRHFGTNVEIKTGTKGKGKIVIHYESGREFERIFEMLTAISNAPSDRRVA